MVHFQLPHPCQTETLKNVKKKLHNIYEYYLFQTGELQPLVASLQVEEEEQLNQMLSRLNEIAEVILDRMKVQQMPYVP